MTFLRRHGPLLVVLGYVLAVTYPNFSAGLGIIDDHVLVGFLGNDGRIAAGEVLPLMRGHALETIGRFRPLFYPLVILETYLSGGDARLLYGSRLAMALVSACAVYAAARTLLGATDAALVALLFFCGGQSELWVRLAASESMAVPLAAAGLALVARRVRPGEPAPGPAALFPGFALLLLSGLLKESFIPLLPAVMAFVYIVLPLLYPGAVRWPARPGARDAVALAVLLTGLAAEVVGVYYFLRLHGHQYSGGFSWTTFAETFRVMLVRFSWESGWVVPAAAGLALAPTAGGFGELARRAALLAACALLLLPPQAMIYATSLHTGFPGRYLAPGHFFAVVAAALGLWWLSRASAGAARAFARVAVLATVAVVALSNGRRVHEQAWVNAVATREFQERLATLIELKQQHPELPLVFRSESALDYEPVWSLQQYLAARLPGYDGAFLVVSDREAPGATPFDRQLVGELRQYSTEGSDVWRVRPISELPDDGRGCVEVLFGKAQPGGCAHSVRIRYLYMSTRL